MSPSACTPAVWVNTFSPTIGLLDETVWPENVDINLLALNKFFSDNQAGLIEQEVGAIFTEAAQGFNTIYSIKDHDLASQKVIDTESETRQKLNDYRKSIIVPTPRGFLVRGELKSDYEAYLSEFDLLEENLFSKTIKKIDELVDETVKKLQISISKRKRWQVSKILRKAKKIG